MLSLQVRPVYVSPGELLITQSDVVNALYYIASGSMEVLQGESVAAILGGFSQEFNKYILPTFPRKMYKWGSEN